MKVLQVNNYHYPRGGSDRYFLDITKLLIENGIDAKTFSTASASNTDEEWYACNPIPPINTQSAVNMKNIGNFLHSREAERRMTSVLQEFRPDVVHLHIYYGQLTASILRPIKGASIPIVQTLHEYKLVCPTHGLYAKQAFCDDCQGRLYWKALFKRCNRGSFSRTALSVVEAYYSNFLGANRYVNRYIAVSNFQKNQLVRLGVQDKKVSVLHHFSTIHANEVYQGKYFLFVGRVNKEKGIELLLKAYSQLRSGLIPLKIVGTGDLEHWKRVADEMHLLNVEWLGFKSGIELEEIYKNSLVVINPSLLNETFGLTCLEAFSHGKPVIATRVGALPEVVDDQRDGFIVDKTPLSLARAMERFISDPMMAVDFGERAINKVKSKFSSAQHFQSLMKIYKEVIEGE